MQYAPALLVNVADNNCGWTMWFEMKVTGRTFAFVVLLLIDFAVRSLTNDDFDNATHFSSSVYVAGPNVTYGPATIKLTV